VVAMFDIEVRAEHVRGLVLVRHQGRFLERDEIRPQFANPRRDDRSASVPLPPAAPDVHGQDAHPRIFGHSTRRYVPSERRATRGTTTPRLSPGCARPRRSLHSVTITPNHDPSKGGSPCCALSARFSSLKPSRSPSPRASTSASSSPASSTGTPPS